MQEIADLAEINKAMLHYYFKTKEQLFNEVFEKAFNTFVERIIIVLNSGDSLKKKVADYVDHTMDSLIKDPGIIMFVMHELDVNPERITQSFGGKGSIDFSNFKKQVQLEFNDKIDAEMFLTDMVAMCVYPFIAQPILKKIMQKDDLSFRQLMEARRLWIKNALFNRL